MSEQSFVKIADFCRTGSGTTPARKQADRYFGGSVPWVKSGELREKEITQTEETVTEDALRETSLKIIPKGAILVAMYGATVGRVGLLGTEATSNQAICHVVPDEARGDRRYLFHALQFLAPYFVSRGAGGAQPNISQQTIKEASVYLPALAEQRRIAAILDQADDLRRLRQRSIDRLDQLGQAIFYEMFGDAGEKNGWKFKTAVLSDVAKKITDGTHQAPKWAEKGIPFIFVSNVRNQLISLDTKKFVDAEEYAKLTRTTPIEEGDVLYTAVGSYGNSAVVKNTEKFVFQRHIAQIKPDLTKLNPVFLSYCLESASLRRQADKVATGIAQKTVTLRGLKSFVIPSPPLVEQEVFAGRIEKISKTMLSEQESLKQFNDLFASLQQRAFKGEL